MVCCWLRTQSVTSLKAKVEAVMASEKASDEVKAACKEWIDTFSVGATNGAATDKLVAALEGMRLRYLQRNR